MSLPVLPRLKRGDVVVYWPPDQAKMECFFFEPIGKMCYLYKYYESIGTMSMASYGPKQTSVRLATPEEKQEFEAQLRH